MAESTGHLPTLVLDYGFLPTDRIQLVVIVFYVSGQGDGGNADQLMFLSRQVPILCELRHQWMFGGRP